MNGFYTNNVARLCNKCAVLLHTYYRVSSLLFPRFWLGIIEAAEELNQYTNRENDLLILKRYKVEKGMKDGKK